jgi:hypothetical protein
VKEEIDEFGKTLQRVNAVVARIRNEQLRAIASCRNALCLSCGRGDVNFMPPIDFVKATNGQYYRAETRDPALFDHGIDVFTKQEICREHTIHSHVPVDMLLSGDEDHMDRPLRKIIKKKPNMTRPHTSNVRIQSKAGKALRQESAVSRLNPSDGNNLAVSGL